MGQCLSKRGSIANPMAPLSKRKLLLLGVEASDELSQIAQAHASSFRISQLAETSSCDQVSDAVTTRTPEGAIDCSHVVALVLDANNRHEVDGRGGPAPSARSRLDVMLKFSRAARISCPHIFIILWHIDAVEDPRMRLAAFAAGANMVSCFPQHVEEVLRKLASFEAVDRPAAATCSCPWCGQTGLTSDELWLHQPLYHIYDNNREGTCCVCGEVVDNLAVHIHEEHHPGGPQREVRQGVGAAVVVHRKRDNKFLMVQEFAGQGFWVPGGATDVGETVRASAVRECQEEAGVAVELQGLAEVDTVMSPFGVPAWCLITFYATLQDEAAAAKTVPCFESAGSCWVGADELGRLPLRSARIPTTWFPHFAAGGKPKPLALPDNLKAILTDVEF